MITTRHTITLKDGLTIEVSEEEAKALYGELKKKACGWDTDPEQPILRPYPNSPLTTPNPPWNPSWPYGPTYGTEITCTDAPGTTIKFGHLDQGEY